MQQHEEEADTFNESQALRKELQGIMTDEGYTDNHTFSEAVHALKGLRDIGLESLQGGVRSTFDEETRWVTSLKEDGS